MRCSASRSASGEASWSVRPCELTGAPEAASHSCRRSNLSPEVGQGTRNATVVRAACNVGSGHLVGRGAC
jgi:hypothetical protein